MNSVDLTDLSEKQKGYYNQQRTEMLSFIPKNTTRILDVGCGDGSFGLLLKENLNTEVWGIEMCEDVANSANEKIDNVLVGDVSDLIDDLPNAHFDCVVFNDVLEHLEDPYSVLLKIKDAILPGGMIVCSIPNVRYFYVLRSLIIKKQWKYENCGVLDKTHLRFFTKRSIQDMFNELGYSAITITGIKPITTLKFNICNILTFGFFADTRYPQFACTAQPVRE